MAFCSSNTETITFSNFATVYTGTSPNLECLPTSGGFTTSAVDATGIVNDDTLKTEITKLLTTFAANPPTSANQSNENQAATFATNATKLRTALQTEYCYYYVRYKFGLEQVLTAAISTALSSSTVTTSNADSTIINQTPSITYGSLKTTTVLLNKKLNELIQIMQKLQSIRFDSLTGTDDSYYSKFSSSSADSTTFNGKLKAQQDSLAAQSKLLQSGSFNDDVKQSMIDYTLEKNASSRNLLAVYGFMNIVAVGLLFYMYKASK